MSEEIMPASDNLTQLPSNIIAPITRDANGYWHKKNGALWKRSEDGKDSCVSESYIKVVGYVRDSEGNEWATMVEFDDLDGNRRTTEILREILLDSRETSRILASKGFKIPAVSMKPITTYLQEANPTKRIRQIKKTGWINDHEYLCPSFQVTHPDSQEVYELLEGAQDWGYGQQGPLAEWQEHAATYCANNHILEFALCVGLAGPLLRFFPNVGTTTMNFFGPTSIGKTTALQVSTSMWGNPEYMHQCRTTDNALESTAAAHNDGFLPLDELGQMDAKDLNKTTYMLGNGKGKSRCNADANLKKIKDWKMSAQCTSELRLEDKLNEAGYKVKGGQEVRFIDIDATVSDETGIYNVLHGFNSGADLSNHLKEQSAKYYGVVAHEFLKRLLSNCDNNPEILRDKVQELYKKVQAKLFSIFALSDAEGPVKRIADVFALCEVAGALAVGFGIFPETLKVEEAVNFVFGRWLQDRGGKKNVEDENIVQHVKDCLMQHSARLIELRDGKTEENRTTYNLLGYFQKDNNTTTYYIIPKSFKKEICKDFSVKTIRNTLKKKGMLEMDGKDNPKKTVNGSRVHFVTIVVKRDSLDEGNQNCDEK
jgi:putative DNA primase/helicase